MIVYFAKYKLPMKQTKIKQAVNTFMKNSVTLNDVAKLAGVSPITVSRVFNYPDLVSKKTAEKVNKAVQQTGYVPNLLAGSLASRRSSLIAVLIPSILNLDYTETARFLIEILENEGFQVFLNETGYNENDEEKAIKAILSRRPEAIVLTGTHHSAQTRKMLLASSIPIVEIWDMVESPLDIIVGFSHYRVGQMAADYFIKKSYSNIAALFAPDYRAQLRLRGFTDTLKQHNISPHTILTMKEASTLKVGRAGFKTIFHSHFRHGGLFCSSDTLAHGALIEAQSLGLDIPKDIHILGFGNQHFSDQIIPALSTIHIDRKMIGQQAAKALIEHMQSNDLGNPIIEVPFKIIERTSTGG